MYVGFSNFVTRSIQCSVLVPIRTLLAESALGDMGPKLFSVKPAGCCVYWNSESR